MRLHRFIGNFDLSKKEVSINDADFINQAKNVLRLRAGDEIILCDGNMNETTARFAELGSLASKLEILKVYRNENEPENYAHLYCPILKKENFELAAQKAVEVGVKEITPIITARTIKLGLNYERLNKIIKEAAEQSGRGILSKLNKASDFEKSVDEAKNKNDLNLFFQTGYSLILQKNADRPKNTECHIGIFVGPEGGWADEEVKTAQSAGFTFAGLGKTVLRAETAAVVASYVAVNIQ
ncbi:MAG: 16S rRNA (uracil(1498)-N(3))-methyltransferase [Candidatus Pacebacteria bacterium]|nr:16S rRNA (uracil(1498)-N(3))-methyltransferase [Candidatus Paceibacterota bacterium]NUQ57362.1 16S rRNA (uracil(1498)-N(3))-methyltransferase [Candidatus Paceibacter sp.]